MNAKLVVFMAVVAVAVCNPAAEEEAAKQKRHLIAAYPGDLAAPWGWNGVYPYSAGAWNGLAINPYTGLPARVAAPWATAPWATVAAAPLATVPAIAPAAAPIVTARPAYLGGADSCDESFNNNNNVNNNNNSVFSSGQVSRDEQKSSAKVPDVDNFLQEAASHPADCGYAMELPQWFDLDKFKRGQDFMQRNTFTLFESKLYGLLSLLAVPSILRVLCMTKQSGDCCSAFNRYYSTISHMFTWYEGDPLEPGSKLYQSLKQIRTRHMLAAKKSKKSGLGLMSQYDMIVTQFGFFGFAFLHPRYFALTQEKRENWEGLLHFWRTIGYLLGIEDRFNLCTGTLEETRKICQAIQNKVLVPGLKDPPPQFEHMSRVLVNGMQCMIPALHYEVLRTIIFEDLLGFAFLCQMSLYGKFMLALYRFVHYQLLTIKWLAAVFRPYFNSQVRLAAYITAHFPFIAYWRYGKSSIHYH